MKKEELEALARTVGATVTEAFTSSAFQVLLISVKTHGAVFTPADERCPLC